MLFVRRAHEHFHSQLDWLSSYWHFSFDQYYDPQNMNWGALRVFNEDVIQPAAGFPMHPHRDMEIITYVLNGTLSHRDNLENKGTVNAGEVQVMTAGTGIVHSEYNASKEKKVHLVQMWVLPEKKGLRPQWGQKAFSKRARANKLLGIVCGSKEKDRAFKDALRIHQDAKLYVGQLEKGKRVEHSTGLARRVYVFLFDGKLEVRAGPKQRVVLAKQDAVRVHDETVLLFRALKASEFLVWDCVDV